MRTLFLALLATAAPLPALALDTPVATRVDGQRIALTWANAGAVDIHASEDPDATVTSATLLKTDDRDGRETVAADAGVRRYFLLRDRGTGKTLRVAEREVPLERGSNFRDLGGYPAAGGKRVKWGRIFRSGAMPLLSDADYARIGRLKIGSVVDLRSLEEREVAPTLVDDRTGALFLANDYSSKALFATLQMKRGQPIVLPNNVYAGMPALLKPQLRAVFARLAAQEGGVLYNCSAGQDRTGITSALILTALGVPRDVIMADYHLSTALRSPANEMPPVDPADYPNNFIVQHYAKAKARPGGVRAEPLYAKDGEAYLAKLFRDLEQRYGSVDAYMAQELGLDPVKRAALRSAYLE